MCFAIKIYFLKKIRCFSQVKELIEEKITCQWYTWDQTLTTSRDWLKTNDKRGIFMESHLPQISRPRVGTQDISYFPDNDVQYRWSLSERINYREFVFSLFTYWLLISLVLCLLRVPLSLETVKILKVSILHTTPRD